MKLSLPRKKALIPNVTEHAHHFIFETPNGHVSVGTCKHCGETKSLANSFTHTTPYLKKLRERQEDFERRVEQKHINTLI